jgi:hypothetical protein
VVGVFAVNIAFRKTRDLLSPSLRKRLGALRKKTRYIHHRLLRPEQYEGEVRRMYRRVFGRDVRFDDPKTYTEKMQWAKLYDVCPLKTELTDKYLVREWVTSKIGSSYLVPLLGVYDRFDDIDLDALPNKFVLKATHGSGWNIIVESKSRLNLKRARKLVNSWMSMNYAYFNFEMHYRDIRPRIILEQYIDAVGKTPNDYKVLCFDGVAKYCWVDVDRFGDHRRNVYDNEWRLQEWQQNFFRNTDYEIPRPANFEEMVRLSEKLAEGFSHVRVDWFNVNGQLFFGEMTFTNGAGFDVIHPPEYDLLLGELWPLDLSKRQSVFGPPGI